ncbi:zinc finger, CCHC-type containing protein, partial [Tanacetum coccineum]
MVSCAVVCVRHSVRCRPKMSQVIRALEGDVPSQDNPISENSGEELNSDISREMLKGETEADDGSGNKVMVVVDSNMESKGALHWALDDTVQNQDTMILLHIATGSKLEPEDGVATIKRRRHEMHGDGVRDSTTASGRGRLKVDLEPSTWRRCQEYKATNTIKLPVGINVVPLRSDTIRLVQNECSFHGLRSEDPKQHLMDFLKLVDLLDLDGENRERMHMRLFQFSLRDQASNWIERLSAGSITTWDDLTTQFLTQFFPPRRTVKLCNDILMFQQHHGESLSEAWTRFKDLLQKVPHHGIDLWLQVQIFYDHVNPVTRRTIDQSAGVVPMTLSIAWKTPNKPLLNTHPRIPMKRKGLRVLSKPSISALESICASLSLITALDHVLTNRSSWDCQRGLSFSWENSVGERVVLPTCEKEGKGRRSIVNLTEYYFIDLDHVNIIPLYLFKKLNIGLLEETDYIFGLADETKSYPVGIVKDVEVHIRKLKLLNDFCVIDMKKDPETPLLVGRGFLATANTVIDCRMAKIA